MITIQMSKAEYEYDVQGLCKSFYPSEQIVFESWEKKHVYKKEETFLVRVEMNESWVCVSIHDAQQERKVQEAVDFANRRQYKNVLKKSLYILLTELSGKQLPWGTLTGVRPSKLVMERLEIGETKEEVWQYMKKQYFCSREKMELGYDIAKREFDILNRIDYKNGYSLYIGIPFCPTRCSYCSFPSYPMEKFGALVEQYLDALFKEIDFVAEYNWKRKLSTVYIGGGTPTTLTARQLRRLLQKIKQSFPMEHVEEFTVEAGRPDSIDEEKLSVLKEEGVTRISINPQTMNQNTLDHIGRKHTVEEVEDAFELARNTGHDNINMDLIVGLPGENVESIRTTLKCIEKLDPDSLTVHSLVVKRAARLNLQLEEEEKKMTENTGEMFLVAAEYAKKHGMVPYYMYRQKNATGMDQDSQENVGFSKPGRESIYNILIMEEKQTILALGAGASSKFLLPQEKKKIERVENVKSVTDYIERIDEMIARKQKFLRKYKEEFFDVPTSE